MVRSNYDVVVIGAGPVGSVAAVAAARTGARVLLLEQNPEAAKRFAGEWIHPTGVEVLDRLRIGRLEGFEARTGYGFVVLPDDGSEPIELAYPSGHVALACEHAHIVQALRDRARALPEVDYVPYARVAGIDGHTVTFRAEKGEHSVHAGRVIGCDGRSSIARKALHLAGPGAPISYMASVELRDVELPVEGYGHVVLGGPGPVLLYRIAPDVIRGCFDVPLHFDASRKNPAFLWDAFAAILPERLRPSFRTALERGPLQWAVNRFLPRALYGKGPVWLAGDSVGHFHPLTAAGLTLGFLDAERAGTAALLDDYQSERERDSYVPELLSNALYHVFMRDDASAAQIRSAVYRVWAKSGFERERTMRILMGAESRRSAFGAAFARMAVAALSSTVSEFTQAGRFKELGQALSSYREWAQWPVASLAPSRGRKAYRQKSTSERPMPLRALGLPVPPSEVLKTRALPVIDTPALGNDGARISDALALAGDALLTELRRLHERIGRDPDWALLRSATRIVASIDAAELGTGMSARMSLAKRPMAKIGMSRLLAASDGGAHEVRASDFASFMLSILSSGGDETIDRLDDGVRHLLSCQRASGGFAAWPEGAEPDFATTALACRALSACHLRYGDGGELHIQNALERARRYLLRTQREDGGWPANELEGTLSNTVHAMRGLIATFAQPGDAALRRAARFLCAAQAEDGTWPARAGERRGPSELTGIAVHALLTVPGPHWGAIQRAVPHLAGELATSLSCSRAEPRASTSAHVRSASSEVAWERCCDMVDALSAYEAQRRARPRVLAEQGSWEDDWAFCKESLLDVSRTFSKPISMLPGDLERAVTCGYLLCRVADTVEDHPSVAQKDKDGLFELFLDVIERGAAPRRFSLAFDEVSGSDAELELARNLPRVMRVFSALPERMKVIVSRWVSEMARGMNLYAHREPGDDGFVALYTVEDLERYCYYVAGTVGHMLTELFSIHAGDTLDQRTLTELRDNAEAFGAGLQLVNILKDVTDDRARRWSFVPRAACERVGLNVDNLTDEEVREHAHRAVAPLFDLARTKLDRALKYALTIPPDQRGVRLFCLLPLWMAALTLVHARGNDAMFVPGEDVKISRQTVEQIIAECLQHASDDAFLRARYRTLWAERSEAPSPSGRGLA